MNIDFGLVLVVATLVTGVIWALDSLLFAKARREEAMAAGDTKVRDPILVDYSKSFFPIILGVLLLRSFLYEPFRIPSGSMIPTLLEGDFILVNKFAYGVRLPVVNTKIIDTGAPQRGEVVVFRWPGDNRTPFIKRVVGLPGDTIAYKDKTIYIKPACPGPVDGDCPEIIKVSREANGDADIGDYQGEVFDEQLGVASHRILINPRFPGRQGRQWTVPDNHYFMMGDNRDNSNDSRGWGFVPEANLMGRAELVWMHLEFADGSGLASKIPRGISFESAGSIQ